MVFVLWGGLLWVVCRCCSGYSLGSFLCRLFCSSVRLVSSVYRLFLSCLIIGCRWFCGGWLLFGTSVLVALRFQSIYIGLLWCRGLDAQSFFFSPVVVWLFVFVAGPYLFAAAVVAFVGAEVSASALPAECASHGVVGFYDC